MSTTNNKFKRFQNTYTATQDNNPNSLDNYLTDLELDGSEIIDKGIPYQGTATSDILNSMLRPITVITVAVADLMAKNLTDSYVSSTMDNETALDTLELAINKLAGEVAAAKILANLDTSDEVGAVSNNDTKSLTSKAVKRSIKKPTNYNDIANLDDTAGYLLDATAAKLLKGKLDAEILARDTAITAANTAISGLKNEIKIKYLGSDTAKYTKIGTEDEFLYIWKGKSEDWDTFSLNNADLISSVLTILTD